MILYYFVTRKAGCIEAGLYSCSVALHGHRNRGKKKKTKKTTYKNHLRATVSVEQLFKLSKTAIVCRVTKRENKYDLCTVWKSQIHPNSCASPSGVAKLAYWGRKDHSFSFRDMVFRRRQIGVGILYGIKYYVWLKEKKEIPDRDENPDSTSMTNTPSEWCDKTALRACTADASDMHLWRSRWNQGAASSCGLVDILYSVTASEYTEMLGKWERAMGRK